ncbi:MAG: hypothetical protein RIQ53_3950 [Pseudomonadota bacterium]|jgi:RND family efflux transporter MFP subunit
MTAPQDSAPPSPVAAHPPLIATTAGPAPRRLLPLLSALVLGAGLGAGLVWALRPAAGGGDAAASAVPPAGAVASAPAGRPALSVALVEARPAELSRELAAEGDVVAWQEASLGPETGGLRVLAVEVEAGDRVRRGQILVRFDDALLQAEARQLRAAVAEAGAALASAAAEARRARQLQPQGALSAQQTEQLLAAEAAAQARLEAQRAALATHELRLARSALRAPDDGVIAARSAQAAPGAVVPAGQELFRLIRQGRLEWRAQVAAEALPALQAGQRVRLDGPQGRVLDGRVLRVAPTIDKATRDGRVDVALPADAALRPGLFLRGRIVLGQAAGLVLPQTAVLLRDGHSLVHVVGADQRVQERRVRTGRREGERIEVVEGLRPGEAVVAAGGSFLSDGDRVRVVPAVSAAAAAAVPSASGVPAAGAAASAAASR